MPDEYLSALKSEIAVRAWDYGVVSWNTVYIGGGTPSLLSPGQLSSLLTSIRKSTKAGNFDSTLEITMEMNPETVTRGKSLKFFPVSRFQEFPLVFRVLLTSLLRR